MRVFLVPVQVKKSHFRKNFHPLNTFPREGMTNPHPTNLMQVDSQYGKGEGGRGKRRRGYKNPLWLKES